MLFVLFVLFVSPSNLLLAKQVEIKWKTASVGLVATTGITLSHMHSELGGLTPWSSVGKARLSVAARGAGVLSETSRRENRGPVGHGVPVLASTEK